MCRRVENEKAVSQEFYEQYCADLSGVCYVRRVYACRVDGCVIIVQGKRDWAPLISELQTDVVKVLGNDSQSAIEAADYNSDSSV